MFETEWQTILIALRKNVIVWKMFVVSFFRSRKFPTMSYSLDKFPNHAWQLNGTLRYGDAAYVSITSK